MIELSLKDSRFFDEDAPVEGAREAEGGEGGGSAGGAGATRHWPPLMGGSGAASALFVVGSTRAGVTSPWPVDRAAVTNPWPVDLAAAASPWPIDTPMREVGAHPCSTLR